MRTELRWKDLWLIALALTALDGLALGLWTLLGWGLRGASHDGRPAADVDLELALMWSGVAVAGLAHLAVWIWGIAKKRPEGWIGSLAGLAALPISYPLGLLAVGAGARLVFG